MSTFVYNSARDLFATTGLNWLTCVPHAVLVNSSYSPQPGDQFLSAVPVGAIMKDVAMTGVAERSGGICYGTIPEFLAYTSPAQVVGLLIYAYTGTPATSQLIYYSSDGYGFPFTPQGFNYAVGYDQAAGGFFQA